MCAHDNIIGDSGAGKSSLAARLLALGGIPNVNILEPEITITKGAPAEKPDFSMFDNFDYSELYPKSFVFVDIVDIDKESLYPRTNTMFDFEKEWKRIKYYKRVANRQKLYEKRIKLGRRL